MKKTRLVGAFLAASALFLAACDEEKAGEDTGSDELVEGESGADPTEDPQSTDSKTDGESEGEGDGDGQFASSLACDTPYDGPPEDLETYTDVYLETNFQLEQLVTELDSDYKQHASGDLSDDDLVANLEEYSHSYSEITAGAIAIGPPEQAAQWHANTVESWVRVCEALTDAHEGIVNEDSTQFAQFEEALNEQPHLLTDIHANTMVGPGETA